MPTDHRLLRIVRAALDALDQHRTLADWADWGGLSERTLTRLFQKEVDMSFARWLQLARLMSAMERLVSGQSVNEISDALGYSSPSHFILMSRRHFGAPPARYLAQAVEKSDVA